MILKGMFFYRLREERKPGFHYHGENLRWSLLCQTQWKLCKACRPFSVIIGVTRWLRKEKETWIDVREMFATKYMHVRILVASCHVMKKSICDGDSFVD